MPNQFSAKRCLPFIPIGASIAYVPLTQGQFALIDAEDAQRVGEFNWYAMWSPKTLDFYAVCHIGNNHCKLHTFIKGESEGMSIDHVIPGYALDCRKSNLRLADQSQQLCNQRLKRNNSSGYKGVSWYSGNKKWVAEIQFRKKKTRIGYFDSVEEAHIAYRNVAEKLHGEFFNLGH